MKKNNSNKAEQISKKTVLLGMSGGVDSSVAALLLKKQGYKVIGAFLKCFSDTKDPLTGECNWLEDKKMARKIAAILNIPLITLDLEKEYKSLVVKPMIQAYKKGLTPNPDISCNTIIKFPLLWKKAKQVNASYIATGHYSRIKKTKLGCQLLAGKDKTKDQSYFLYELNQSDLSHTLFPIGNLTKKRVRQIAKKHNFPNWNKLGTRGICFIGKINMKSFLEKSIKHNLGKVLNPEGKIIGIHPGIAYYTIGQRIGSHIGIEIKKPKSLVGKKFYLAEKIKPNTIISAPENHPILKKKEIIIKNLHLINPSEKISQSLKARIRHLGKFIPGILIKQKNNFSFIFNKPLEGIAEGQSIVLYQRRKVIGGGEISLE